MARGGVQYDDVRRAIDILLQRGESPSVQKVREVLGTGSFTTISDHLRAWKEQREMHRDQPLPQAIPEPVEALTQALWQQAQENAVEGLARYRQEADREIDEAKAQADTARREAEDAAQREAVIEEHLHQARARLEEHSARIARLEAQAEAAAHRESQLEQQLYAREETLQQLQADNERQTVEHKAMLTHKDDEFRAQLAQEEQRHESAEARLMTLLDGARQERQSAERQHSQRLITLEKRLLEVDSHLQQARRDFNDEQALHRETKWMLCQAQERLREETLNNERLEEALEEKHETLERVRKQLHETEARLARIPLPPFVY